MQRILYFFPHKFSSPTNGIDTRIITLLEYFKSRGFVVDMISFNNKEMQSSYVVDKGLVNAIYYIDNVKGNDEKKRTIAGFLRWKISNQYRKLFPKPVIEALPNLMTDALTDKVVSLHKENTYDTVLVTYTYWADIVKQLKKNKFSGRTIIDPTDFLTLQQFYGSNQQLPLKNVGIFFGNELEMMSQFDCIMHISYDECLLFSSFLPGIRHVYVPQFFEEKKRIGTAAFKYDILFIGSNNPYNVEGINWFLESVYPLLDKNLNIAIAGNVCSKIMIDLPNVSKLGFVEDAAALYSISKCTICPLKKGTGMKIKVIESLSYGIPVIGTYKSVDGFLNKKPEGGVMVCNTPMLFAAKIKEITRDTAYYNLQCKLAEKLFKDNFSIEKNFSQLDEIFN